LIGGETVNAVAKRYELIPSTVSDWCRIGVGLVSDWRRMARQGKLVLPNLDGMDFVPVEIGMPSPLAAPLSATSCSALDVITGDVTVRLDAAMPAARIAEIARAMAT
jgi:transposase